MSETHYQVLQIHSKATADEIKQSYRQLAKKFHPDVNGGQANADLIVKINAAYEILGDDLKRREYDYFLAPEIIIPRQQQASAHIPRRPARPVGHEVDEDLILWLNQVYTPINRMIGWIIKPLKLQIQELSGDPFDDELMGKFEAYVTECQQHLQKIDKIFHSMSNPSLLAEIAANLYYTINQVADGVKELNFYVMNYDESCLHDGVEMFKIAAQLQKETNKKIKSYR